MDMEKTYKGRHTLVMIPTYLRASDSIYVEFSPFYFVGNKPMPFKDILQLETGSAKGNDSQRGKIPTAFYLVNTEDGDVGKNNGTLCPPPSGCNAQILDLADKPE
jgi:hypothetical protein